MHPEVDETIRLLQQAEDREGLDPFGFRPEMVGRVLPFTQWLYRHWFRAEVSGMEQIPAGRVLLIANHSGQLPYDGAMIATAMLLELRPPRMTRTMVEKWVATLPWISTFFSRCGQAIGTPANARRLLKQGEAILVFPEGTRGISKPFEDRYQLQEFGLGFMRLALETGTPIVPVGLVGAEEQLPSLMNIEFLARLLKTPAVPLTPTLFIPLPVKYRIYFGEPMYFEGDFDDEDRIVREKVERVTGAIEALLQRGLRERSGIFR